MANTLKFGYVTGLVLVLGLPQVFTFPADDRNQTQPEFGNLKYTFGSRDEIPAAFFQANPTNAPPRSNSTAPTSSVQKRAYKACQDGSGGMCVDSGTCPNNLRPDTSDPSACSSGQECCFGPPITDRKCRSRGGECKLAKECGAAPTFQEAEDCDKKNGQVCCILI